MVRKKNPNTLAAIIRSSKKKKAAQPPEKNTAAKARKKLGVVKPAELTLRSAQVVIEDVIANKYRCPPYQRKKNLWVGRGGSVGEGEAQYIESCAATNSVPGVFYFCTIKKGAPDVTTYAHILDGLQRLSTLVRLHDEPKKFGYTKRQVESFFETAKMHVTKYHFETIADAIEMFRRINDYGVRATDYEIFSGWLKETIEGLELIKEIDAAMCEVDGILMGTSKAKKLTLEYADKNSGNRTKNHRLFRTSLALFLAYVESDRELRIMPKQAHRNQPEAQVEYKLAVWLKTVTAAEATAAVENFRTHIRRAARLLRFRQKAHTPEKKDHAWSVTAARAMLLVSLKYRLRDFTRFVMWYLHTFRAQEDWPSRAYLANVSDSTGKTELIAVPQTTVGAIDWRLYSDDISSVGDLPLACLYSETEIRVTTSSGQKRPALLEGKHWSHIVAQNGGTAAGNEELYGVTVPEDAAENLLRGNRDMSPEELAQFVPLLAAKKAVLIEKTRKLTRLTNESPPAD